jgi:hypothetical protein
MTNRAVKLNRFDAVSLRRWTGRKSCTVAGQKLLLCGETKLYGLSIIVFCIFLSCILPVLVVINFIVILFGYLPEQIRCQPNLFGGAVGIKR